MLAGASAAEVGMEPDEVAQLILDVGRSVQMRTLL
jgi:hypothetical protein